ncbi:MAG: ABC transporter ATP-binding protein [Myxococcota bacterium]
MNEPNEPTLLRARGLTKRYGTQTVVSELDLDCDAGRVLGLLGPNGAGKTTTLRMLYGFARPDAGSVEVLGQDFQQHRKELKRYLGVCTQDDTLDYDFSVRQNLRVYANYFRPAVPDVRGRVNELLETFGLGEYADASPRALSGGYVRRLLIARSIVHRPGLLFLDEPTTGLDPAARVEVWELVASLRAAGMGIILTTHYMDEAERLSDSLLVLQRGKAVARGQTSDVLGTLLGEHVLVMAESESQDIEAHLRTLGRRPSHVLGEMRLPLRAAQLAALSAAFPERRLTVRPPNLDDLFLALAEEGAEEGAEKSPEARMDGGP